MRRILAEEFRDRASEYLDAPKTLAREVLALRRTEWDDLGDVAPDEIAAHFRRS